MDKAYREAHPEETFDGGYHLWAQEQHKARVAKNPDRIAYAIQQFEAHGIEYALKNEQTGHFHCWRKSDDPAIKEFVHSVIGSGSTGTGR